MTREEAARVLKAQADYYGELFASMVTAGDYSELRDLETRMEALEVGADALRGSQPDPDTGLKGCWHCINIEAHHIEYVIAVKAKGGTPMNTPVDCPYHYCPACGRKLEEKK